MSDPSAVFACDTSAMTADQRTRHRLLAAGLTGREALEELPDGYALRFPADPARLLELTEFIALERLCCPFLTLAVEFRGEHLRLRLTGPDGVKPFLAAELGLLA